MSSSERRWLVPIGAVLVHLAIGSVYAWSTFNRPVQALFPDAPWWLLPPYTTFTTALAILGLSAALLGPWVERRGPRVAARAAAVAFGSGLLLGGLGLALANPWLVWLGMGAVGGIGCGLGYIAPVSTLVRWFPDRRGMATGMAIMGFGGGAFVAGYLNVALIARIGIAPAVMVLGVCYLGLMLLGAQLLRRPPADWSGPAASSQTADTTAGADRRAAASWMQDGLTRDEAIRTPQFVLLWAMLCINVTAGIGILAQASPMMQDLFGRSPAEAAAVVSVISLFNAGGRFVWASASDWIGRRATYLLFFVLQVVLFLAIPRLAAAGAWWPFQLTLFAIFTMYGGGFATIPAYLADVFGTRFVGAIHGAVLTAWSVAAIAGPLLITELAARARSGAGTDPTRAYDLPLQLLAGLLAVGAAITLFVRPVRQRA